MEPLTPRWLFLSPEDTGTEAAFGWARAPRAPGPSDLRPAAGSRALWREDRGEPGNSLSPEREGDGRDVSPAGSRRERPGAAAAWRWRFSSRTVTVSPGPRPCSPPRHRSGPSHRVPPVPQTAQSPSAGLQPASVPGTAARGPPRPSPPQGPGNGPCPPQGLVRSTGTARSDPRGVSGGARDEDSSADSEGVTVTANGARERSVSLGMFPSVRTPG